MWANSCLQTDRRYASAAEPALSHHNHMSTDGKPRKYARLVFKSVPSGRVPDRLRKHFEDAGRPEERCQIRQVKRVQSTHRDRTRAFPSSPLARVRVGPLLRRRQLLPVGENAGLPTRIASRLSSVRFAREDVQRARRPMDRVEVTQTRQLAAQTRRRDGSKPRVRLPVRRGRRAGSGSSPVRVLPAASIRYRTVVPG